MSFLRINQEEKYMRDYLNRMLCSGIVLYMDDKMSTPSKVANVCVVHETGRYMSDYVTNDRGEWT